MLCNTNVINWKQEQSVICAVTCHPTSTTQLSTREGTSQCKALYISSQHGRDITFTARQSMAATHVDKYNLGSSCSTCCDKCWHLILFQLQYIYAHIREAIIERGGGSNRLPKPFFLWHFAILWKLIKDMSLQQLTLGPRSWSQGVDLVDAPIILAS